MRRFAGDPCRCHTRIPVAIAPRHLLRIGVPPKDLIDDIAAALRRAGVDFDGVFTKCVEVSTEWEYDMNNPQNKPPSERFSQKYIRDRQVQMVHKSREEVLNPQPIAWSSAAARRLAFRR